MPPSGVLGKAKWIGPVLLFAGGALLAAAFLYPRAETREFAFGLFYTLTRYDQALPLLGIGIAVAQMPLRLCMLGTALFVFGILMGSIISDLIAAALSANPGLVGYVFLIGPACCVIVGLSLAAPRRVGAWLTPPAALLSGAALGVVVSFNDPTFEEWSFAGGAVVAGLWLVLPPLLVWRFFAKPWFAIPARIFGSWLIAIGAMLSAAHLIPRPLQQEPPPAIESPADPGEPLGIEPPGSMPESESPASPLGLPDSVQ